MRAGMLALLLPAFLAAATALETELGRAMAGRSGTAVALDVKSGKLLAAYHLDVAARTLAPPGSTLKPFTLLALLESGRLRSDERQICRRTLLLAGHRMDCTHVPVSQPLDAENALAYSCNYWFAHFAARLTDADLMQSLARAGLTSRTGLAPLEATGVLEPAPSLEQRQLQALGEARVLVTPLALAAAYRRLALARRASPVYSGLDGAISYGTGRLAQPGGVSIAGKTGTAGHAWFAGWAPADAPRIVLVVFLSQGSGGGDAAPVARRIFSTLAPGQSAEVMVRKAGERARMPLEEYVTAVLAGESGGASAPELLKAMAVAVRTYALHYRGRHRTEGFDFCDTTHCQELRRGATATPLRDAAEATHGEALWFEGSPAATYYHRSCAGSTEAAHYVWPGLRRPYLRQVADTFCVARGRLDWNAEILKDELRRALAAGGLKMPAALQSVAVTRRTPSGRVDRLELRGATSIPLSASSFRFAVGRSLGWSRMPSTWFDIQDAGDRLIVHGYGAGHGVGLCQLGAAAMAQEGRTYRQILDFYYPGTILSVTAKGLDWHALAGERVEVLTTRFAQDRAVPALADGLLRAAEARTGLDCRVKPQIRIYPTVAAFRDATGEPGWVAASRRGRVIRLQPASAMESTLRHEFLHLLVETHARLHTPLWFREGLVLYLMDPEKPPAPEDAVDVKPPRTREQMRRSYEAARSRVRRLVDEHGERTVLGWVTAGVPEPRP